MIPSAGDVSAGILPFVLTMETFIPNCNLASKWMCNLNSCLAGPATFRMYKRNLFEGLISTILYLEFSSDWSLHLGPENNDFPKPDTCLRKNSPSWKNNAPSALHFNVKAGPFIKSSSDTPANHSTAYLVLSHNERFFENTEENQISDLNLILTTRVYIDQYTERANASAKNGLWEVIFLAK